MKSSEKSVLVWLTEPGRMIRSVALLSLVIIPFVASLLILPAAQALTISSSRDCDNNAVINCGALTTSELKNKYNSAASTRTIFHNFGITHVDIDAIGSTAVEGKVTKGGRVLVNGREVATDAVTAGRQSMPGSQAVTANGVTFYKRPPSVSFASSSLPAFVVMKNGQFDFAIIASCGNPVKAKAVVKKQPQPAPAPTPAPQPQPKQIPNTGIGDIAGFGSFVALASGAIHLIYKRRILG